MTPFDVAGPLPRGRVLLEASAGTGKTWAIAALTVRYVAEADIPIERLLAVTFTRAATSELRGRIRERLVTARRHLLDPSRDGDPVLRHLADCDRDERLERASRIDRALRSYDRATISTLHGFASRLLGEMGLIAVAPGRVDLIDVSEVFDDVVDDVWVSRYGSGDREPLFGLGDFRAIAQAVVEHPDAAIVPPSDGDPEVAERITLALLTREAIERRARSTHTQTYDNLLLAARNALVHPSTGDQARSLVGDRYDVALVDEFQDTDRVQWETVDRLFPADRSTLVIIGDPKQSIYAFRGADVTAYLSAADACEQSHTLDVNWRSDGPLLAGLDRILDGAVFGDPRIAYRRVTAAPDRDVAALPDIGAPIEFRYVSRSSPVSQTTRKRHSKPAARQFIADDVAASIVDMTEDPAVQPGDIAVLCRTGAEVDEIRAALKTRGIPAVVGRTGSVFTSAAADHWLTLLAALEQPSSTRNVRALALTPFFGWSIAQLVRADDNDLLPLHEQVESWATTLHDRDIAAVWKEIERTQEVTARILSEPGGERLATDMDHLTELLHDADRNGARSLQRWLVERQEEARERGEGDETMSRRLETDADAVQVLTIHASKGLEFPIVLLPFLWSHTTFPIGVPVHHDPASDRRVIAVGGDGWSGNADAIAAATRADEGEEMRLVYVALTRARHHLRIWWAPATDAEVAPITTLAFGRLDDGGFVEKLDIGSDRFLIGKLEGLVDGSDGTIGLEVVNDWPHDRHLSEPGADSPAYARAVFDRDLDRVWGRASFSSLSSGEPAAVTVDPPPTAKLDEPVEVEPVEVENSPLPMASLPGGVGFGSMVHSIFEQVDFNDPVLEDSLRTLSSAAVDRFGSTADPDQLAEALSGVIHTPVADGWRLADIPSADTVAEMEFELPLAVDGEPFTTAAMAERLEAALPADHPFRPYVDRLRSMRSGGIRGYLTGSLDVVIRRDDRYWVADYKTNRLGERGGEPTLHDYRPEGLDAAMLHGDYVLQSLLYQVALHRFLRSRLPGYDPSVHLGGSLYLFVRGMIGPDTPPGYGVQRWDAIPGLVDSVSELFEVGG